MLVSSHCPELSFSEEQVEHLFLTLDKSGSFDPPAGELSIAFVSKDEISQIHADFMDDPSPTDVITFPGDPDIDQAGEICVCPQVAEEYSKANKGDFSDELGLYLIHGYLHLCGFDDIDEEDRQDMRKAEQQALDIVKQAHALPHFKR